MQKVLQARILIPIIGLVLILGGLLFVVRYAKGTLDAYRAMRFAQENDFHAGNLDVDLVRPWMNLRYIAVAYAVPQGFLFDELDLEMSRVNSDMPLGRLNRRLGYGPRDDQPILVNKVREAINQYWENPVSMGLGEDRIRPWMSIQYIANSTGIPAQVFFEQVGIPMEGHAYMPLEVLVREVSYDAGRQGLVEEIQQIIDAHPEAQR